MRCKCGFNSFDHNLACPKCHKDLTATRRLLNLEIPAPGGVNFFQIAGQRMATPQPFLGAAVGGEDFPGDLQPEDIQPVAYSASQPPPPQAPPYAAPPPPPQAPPYAAPPPPQAPPYAAPPPPQAPPYAAPPPPQAPPYAAPPPPPPPPYAAPPPPPPPQVFAAPARPAAAPVDEPMIEIEVTDDFEADQPGNRAQAEETFTPVNPLPIHQAAMNQIKSTLTETGDLAPEAEGNAYVLGAQDLTPAAPAPNRAAEGGGGDDFSSLVGDVNLDDLEGDL